MISSSVRSDLTGANSIEPHARPPSAGLLDETDATRLSCVMQPSVRQSHSMLESRVRPGLLDRPHPRGARRALDAARDPRRLQRHAGASTRSRRTSGVARNVLSTRLALARRRGHPREARLPGAPAPLRVLPHREGARPVAGDDRRMLHWGDRYLAEPDGPPMLIRHKGCGGLVDDRGYCETLRRAPRRPRRLHRVRAGRAGASGASAVHAA